MKEEQERQLRMLLIEAEVEALRSVLSEFEGDKHEYIQMIKADAIRSVLNGIRSAQ